DYARRRGRLPESAEHGPVEHGLRRRNRGVRIAHHAPRNESAFDYDFRLDAKERRLPQDQVRQLARLDRTYLGCYAVRDRRIDRIFRNITLYAKVVVAFRVLRQSTALDLHLVRGLPRPKHDFADPSHRLAVAREHAEDA